MLVLTRKVSERVRLRFAGPDGPVDVWVVVIELPDHPRSGRIGLGFDGPRDVGIHREEVLDDGSFDGTIPER